MTTSKKNLTQKEKDLIKKYETNDFKKQRNFSNEKREMYLKQTDRNYKDGDRN